MTGLIRRSFLLAVGSVLLLSMPAMATSVTFTSADGIATFNIQPTFIDITLTNTFSPVDAIAKELDGLTFTTINGSGSAALSQGAGNTAAGELDCTAPNNVPGCKSIALEASPWGWELGGSTNNLQLLASGNGGFGSLHPYAIVNGTVDGSQDGVSNGQHNPLLLGPVTFRLNLTGTAPDGISNVVFYFGTTPDKETGTCTSTCGTVETRSGPGISPVPEPTSLLLIGSGLVIGARRVRRSLKKRA